MDANGLSAYLAWLKDDVLGVYSSFASELNDPSRFSPRDMNKLRDAVQEGESGFKLASPLLSFTAPCSRGASLYARARPTHSLDLC